MTAKKTVEVYTNSGWVTHNPLRDRATDKVIPDRFITVGTVTISWDDKNVTSFAKAESDIVDTADGKSDRMAPLLNAAAAEAVGRSSFNVFSENELILGSPSEVNKDEHTKIVVPVAAHYFKRLEEQQARYKLALESVDYARKRLYDYAISPTPSGYANDSEEMFRFIQDTFAAGHVGSEAAWMKEKMGRIRDSLDEIERRTNRRHEGFIRAQEEIRGILANFPVPRSWWREPPVLEMKK